MDKLEQKINYKIILTIVLILAIIIRMIFISFSRIDRFQFDVGVFNIKNSEDYEKILDKDESVFFENRHLDYILQIYETGKLPNKNDVQLYHPPLHHIISALWLKTIDYFQLTAEAKLESLQILTCIYSIIILFIILKILDELEVEIKYKIIALLLCGFHPLFVYISGFINNDILLTLFCFLSILYTLKWYKNPNYKNAIILAIIIGLGTLVKSSMLVNIMIAGTAFFIKLLENIDKKEYSKVKKIIFQGILFFIISLPLIFCYPIRNYILFNQPFFGIVNASEVFYVGNDNIVSRFGIFSEEILNNKMDNKNQNILSYVIKSAIVFETGREGAFGTTFLKIISIVLIILTLLIMIKLIFSKDKKNYILILGYIFWIIFFIAFNYQMPNSCSMHSRYIITAIMLSIILLVKYLQEKNKIQTTILISCLSCVFAISSIVNIILSMVQVL